MANQKTKSIDPPRDGHGQNNQVKIALALTVALVSPAVSIGKPCQAADFRHAKKIVVPATNIPRRYDYSSSSGRESGLPAGYESNYDSSYAPQDPSYGSGSSSSSSKSSKYGLVPPPPPVTPSLLPSSMVGDVPAPPSAPAIVSRVSPSTAAASHQSLGSNGYQQTSGDPTRSTSLSRHATNSKTNKMGAETSIISQVTAQSDALVKEGKLQEAQDLLEKYEKTYPKNTTLDHKLSEVSLERAKYYIRHDDYVEAGKQARIALHHNSNNTDAKHALDQVLQHHGVDPNHAQSRVKMGDMLFSQGKLKEAHVEYDAALKIHHSGEAYIGLGNIALRENKLKEAKAHYQLALEREPESSVALRQLGIVRYKLKDVVGANADLSRALVLNQDDKVAGQTLIELWQRQVSMRPNDANSHLGLARAHQLAGDLKSAQNTYRTVVSIDPNHPNLPAARQSFKLALARQEAQKTYEAAKTLDGSGAIAEAYAKAGESVSLSPGDVKYRLYQGELAERLGNYPDAKQIYIEVLRQDPKNLVAAGKVKSLSELLSAGDTAQTLRGPLGAQSQGLQAEAGSLGMPMASSLAAPLAMAAEQGASGGSITGLPRLRGEGPALSSLPAAPNAQIPTVDPVNSMSGFLGDLRNFMVVQKKELQKHEDNILDAVNGKKPDSGSKLADLPPLPAGGGSDIGLPKNMISSSDVQKLLKSAGVAPSSAASSAAAGSAGATSSADIARLLGGGSTAGSTASGGATGLGVAGLAAALPALSGLAPGMSGLAPANPPSSLSDTSFAPQYNPGNSRVGDTIISSPRESETVLKLADTPAMSANTMPPVAPQRFASVGAGSAFSAQTPQTAPQIGNLKLSPEMIGLAAQAQSLSPEALSGIAKSLGMEPAHVKALASQALQQAPGMINKGIANIKQEDIDKMAALLKHHVAAKQQALGMTVPKSTETVTTKATPQLVKKVDSKKTIVSATKTPVKLNTTKNAVASKPATAAKSTAVKPTVAKAPSSSNSTFNENALRAATGGGGTPTFNPTPVAETADASASTFAPTFTPAPEAEAMPSANNQRLDSLEAQNKTLLSQLEDTKKQLQELRESVLSKPTKPSKSSSKKLKTSKKQSSGSTDSGSTQPPTQVESSAPPVSGMAPAGNFAPSTFAETANPNLIASNLSNPMMTAAPAVAAMASQVPSAVPAALDSASFINLELSGINVRPKGVRLNVVLRNGTGKELALPPKTKAVVRMVGAPDQIADVIFPVKALTPGQESKGYISVSGHKLDPSADVFIPKLMDTEAGQKDVHLTVPISALSNIPH